MSTENTASFSEISVGLLLNRGITFTAQLEENIAILERHFQDIEFELKFEITNTCNLNCSFCHQHFGHSKETKGVFSLKDFQQVIASVKMEKQIRYARITGGEPTLHPQITGFLETAKNAGMHSILNTNAVELDVEKLIPVVDLWKISMPSYEEETTNKLTGNPHAWKCKMENLKVLHSKNATVDILVVLTQDNILHLKDFIDIHSQFPNFTMTFLRQESNSTFRTPLTRTDIEAALTSLIEVNAKIELAIPFCSVARRFHLENHAIGRIGCGPWSSLVVNADGNVRQCYSRRRIHPKRETYLNTAIKLAAQDFSELPETCLNCQFGARCLGGCRSPLAMKSSPFGQIDYLADFNNLPLQVNKGKSNRSSRNDKQTED